MNWYNNHKEEKKVEEERKDDKSVTKRILLCKDVEGNDPALTTIFPNDPISYSRRGYGYDLGSALLHNTHIQSIDYLDVIMFLPPDDDDSDADHSDTNGTTTDQSILESAAPFVKFLRESKSLRRLHVRQYYKLKENMQPVLRQIQQAVAHNKHIEEIRLDLRAAPDCIAEFFASSHIKSFSLQIWDFGGTDGMDLVLSACRTNRTLETLTLIYRKDSTALDSVAAVVSALVGHPTIRVLTVETIGRWQVQYRRLMVALLYFAGGTPSLKHLEIKYYWFNCEHMTLLLDGLSTPQLSLHTCHMDPGSFEKLASYVQTSPTLKELALSHRPSSISLSYKDLLVGSSLQVLDLSNTLYVDLSGLFTALGTTSADNIRLPYLYLGWNSPCCSRDVLSQLPKLIYLRELHARSVPRGVGVNDFIDSIKQNGSLHNVFLTNDKGEGVHLGPLEDKMLESVCTRNRMLGGLLKQYDVLNNVERHKDNMKLYDHLSLFPLLLRSASKMQRMGPNFILIGLLSTSMSVGVAKDGKRLVVMR